MKVRHEMCIGLQRQLLISSLESMREGFLKHKDLDTTLESLRSKFERRDPTPLMLFSDSGKCTPAGMSFCALFVHDDPADSRVVIQCMMRVIAELRLTYERQDRLVVDLIRVIEKSKITAGGLAELKRNLLGLLPQQKRMQAAA